MKAGLILWPMVIHVLVTLALYIPMSRARVRSVRQGAVKAAVYRLNRDEPEESLRFTNAIRNQNETGLLFYAGVLTAFASQNVGPALVVLAWAFALVKTVHVLVHVTTNRLRRRRPIFMASFLALVAFWLVLAAQLAGVF